MSQDVRWIQRFSNLKKAFLQLKDAVELHEMRELSNLEKQGLIQAFEYTHELAWKTLKDFLESKGAMGLIGSKDTAREAFKVGIIEDGEAWMSMIISRNETSHTYDEGRVAAITDAITGRYFAAFGALVAKLDELAAKESL
jgi:nucleotidyltransferase substrate binding protein (TIGR01987 family)